MESASINFDKLAVRVALFVAFLGLVITGLSVYCLLVGFAGRISKDVFESVVVHALLPMFTSGIAAVLAWVFGKHLVAALAVRLATH